MADKILGNNQVNIYGEVVSEFAFSHEVYGEGFYMVYLSVKRLSQVYDKIPLMVSERLIDITKDYRGMYMEASGQFRSYNRHEENHNRLVLSVFVRDLHIDEEEMELYFFGWLFVQTTGLSKDTAWKRNCGPFDGCQSSVWKIRLHPLYLLGKKCSLCRWIWCRRTHSAVGTDSEP